MGGARGSRGRKPGQAGARQWQGRVLVWGVALAYEKVSSVSRWMAVCANRASRGTTLVPMCAMRVVRFGAWLWLMKRATLLQSVAILRALHSNNLLNIKHTRAL